MSDSKIIRLSLRRIQPGMICAEDVFNSSGALIIPANSMITQNSLFRIRVQQISSIRVYEPEEYESNMTTMDKPNIADAFMNKEGFVNFSQNYVEATQNVRQFMEDIKIGNDISADELYSCCNHLLEEVKNNNNLFNYLYHLKVSDDYTFSHCLNVSLICNAFGHWLKLSGKDIEGVTLAGLLHDIGKLSLDTNILNKIGDYTEEEFEIFKTHPQKGFELLKDQNLSQDIKLAVLQHHEKFDGSGYPYGLKNKETNKFAKIVSIADIYDSMTTNRIYNKRISPFKVIEMFEREGYQVFDTAYMYVFLERIAENYVGSSVRLSNGNIGKIIFINKKAPSRPLIQSNENMYNLEFDNSLEILEII